MQGTAEPRDSSSSLQQTNRRFSNSSKMDVEAQKDNTAYSELEKQYNDSVVFQGANVLRGSFDPVSKMFWIVSENSVLFHQRNADNAIQVELSPNFVECFFLKTDLFRQLGQIPRVKICSAAQH